MLSLSDFNQDLLLLISPLAGIECAIAILIDYLSEVTADCDENDAEDQENDKEDQTLDVVQECTTLDELDSLGLSEAAADGETEDSNPECHSTEEIGDTCGHFTKLLTLLSV